MQETEIRKDIDQNVLKISGYNLEIEKNSTKSRVGIYVSNAISYVRRTDLEGTDSNIIIIDLEGKIKTRIINVYRSFAPSTGMSQRENFKYQLSLIKKAFSNMNCVLLITYIYLTKAHCASYYI